MTDTDTQIAEDDAGILAAAAMLCWDQRPVLMARDDPLLDAAWWWEQQTEDRQRKYLRAARIVVGAWEAYWKKKGR